MLVWQYKPDQTHHMACTIGDLAAVSHHAPCRRVEAARLLRPSGFQIDGTRLGYDAVEFINLSKAGRSNLVDLAGVRHQYALV